MTSYYEIPNWDKTKYNVIPTKKKDMVRVELPDVMPINDQKYPIVIDIRNKYKKSPTIIIHPILGGNNTVAEIFSWYFINVKKWNTVIVHRSPHPKGTPEAIEGGLRNIMTNNLQVLQFLEFKQQPFINFNRDKAAMVGTSLGGITTAMLTRIMPLKAFVMVMAGQNIPTLFVNSQEFAKEWLPAQLKENGMTKYEFKKALEKVLKSDPKYLARQGEKCYMIQSLIDRSVQYKNQKALWKTFGKKCKRLRLISGHYSMFIYFPLLFWRIGRFLEKKLS